jgi:hypothetical protein
MDTLRRRSVCALALALPVGRQVHASPSRKERAMNTDSFTFDGRLLELPPPAPRCGDVKVAVGYRFAVLKVLYGPKEKSPITLVVPCPDLKGDGFMVAGATYRVKAAREIADARTYTVYNEYKDGKVFWALDISRT